MSMDTSHPKKRDIPSQLRKRGFRNNILSRELRHRTLHTKSNIYDVSLDAGRYRRTIEAPTYIDGLAL